MIGPSGRLKASADRFWTPVAAKWAAAMRVETCRAKKLRLQKDAYFLKAIAMFDRAVRVLVRLLAAVLLSAISMHATAPAKSLEQSRGSAFNAATVDVAVLGSVRQVEKAVHPQPMPAGPPIDCIGDITLLAFTDKPDLFRSLLWSHAPPAESIRTRTAQPRAPPSHCD